MQSINKTQLKCLGTVDVTMEIAGRNHNAQIFICKDVTSDIYLSLEACRELNIIHKEFPTPIHVVNEERKGQSVKAINASENQVVNEGRKDQAVKTSIKASKKQDTEKPKGNKSEPTKEQIEKIKAELLDEFKDVFDSNKKLKPMAGPPMRIELKEDAEPSAIYSARAIPYAYKEKAKAQLFKMLRMESSKE